MDWFLTLAAMIMGLVVRFGIPVLLTAVVIFILRRMDDRWQAEAKGESPAPIVPLRINGKRCWEIKGCPEEDKVKCPAVISQQPCWQVFRDSDGHLRERCLSCEVFLKAPIPVTA